MTTTDIAEIGCGGGGAGDCAGADGADPGGGLRISRVPNSEPPPLGLGSPRPVPSDAAVPHRVPMPPPDPVDVGLRRFAISATTVLLEMMGGRRPVAHLGAVALPHIVDQFRVLLAADVARGPACTLLRLHTQHPRPDVAEITVVYSRGDRVQALGARVERRLMPVRPATPGGRRRREPRCVLVSVSVG
jgi:Family of unknown function (DUF6459)